MANNIIMQTGYVIHTSNQGIVLNFGLNNFQFLKIFDTRSQRTFSPIVDLFMKTVFFCFELCTSTCTLLWTSVSKSVLFFQVLNPLYIMQERNIFIISHFCLFSLTLSRAQKLKYLQQSEGNDIHSHRDSWDLFIANTIGIPIFLKYNWIKIGNKKLILSSLFIAKYR